MKYEKNDLILFDCDGVMLDWVSAFLPWIQRKGYNQVKETSYDLKERYDVSEDTIYQLVEEFNNSSHVGALKPFPGVVALFDDLDAFNLKIRIVTSMTDNPIGQMYRRVNIIELFNNNIIDVVTFLPCNSTKENILEQYKNSGIVYVEDSIQNAEIGCDLGLHSILIERPYNKHYKGPIPMFNDWFAVEEEILYVTGRAKKVIR